MHYSLADEDIEQPMNEFLIFSLQVNFLSLSCLIEEKGFSHFLFIINHSQSK